MVVVGCGFARFPDVRPGPRCCLALKDEFMVDRLAVAGDQSAAAPESSSSPCIGSYRAASSGPSINTEVAPYFFLVQFQHYQTNSMYRE